jgi:sugar phosphate isomerase/epimerase
MLPGDDTLRCIPRRRFLKLVGTGLAQAVWAAAPRNEARGQATWQAPLYAMDTWFWRAPDAFTIDQQAALLRELGYAGMALSWGRAHTERLAALQAYGLTTPGCYIVVTLDEGYPARLTKCVKLLAGTEGRVWLALQSNKYKKGEERGDKVAMDILMRCAASCAEHGVRGIALYPHVGFWMETTRTAARLAEQTKRREVGLQFNQYHWQVAEGGEDLRGTLARVRPFLTGVSINGSGTEAPSILPLGEGGYDVVPVVRELYRLGYEGPISHQGYSIEGNLRERLAEAKAEWDRIRNRVVRESGRR